jgi:hypothetical protein
MSEPTLIEIWTKYFDKYPDEAFWDYVTEQYNRTDQYGAQFRAGLAQRPDSVLAQAKTEYSAKTPAGTQPPAGGGNGSDPPNPGGDGGIPNPPTPPPDDDQTGKYENGKVYTFTTEDGKKYYSQYSESPKVTGTDALGYNTYTYVGSWSDPTWDETGGMTAYQQASLDYQKESDTKQLALQQNQQMLDELAAQNQRTQSNRDYNSILQGQADAPSRNKQARYEADMQAYNDTLSGLKGPSDWVSYWKTAQSNPTIGGFGVAPVATGQNPMLNRVATGPQDAAARGYGSWVTPDQMSAQQQNSSTTGWIPQFDETGMELAPQFGTVPGIYQGKIYIYDPSIGTTRLESDAEYQGRTVGDPWYSAISSGGLQSYAPTNDQKWDYSVYNATMQDFVQQNGRMPTDAEQTGWLDAGMSRKDVGPQLPAWASQFNTPTQQIGSQSQVDVGKLSGWSMNPVSQQTWNSMAPTERSGLQGLVEATGKNFEDYAAQSQNMWNTQGPQVARRKTAVY